MNCVALIQFKHDKAQRIGWLTCVELGVRERKLRAKTNKINRIPVKQKRNK